MRKPLVRSDAPAVVIVIRLMVGAVFLSEGIQKLLFADQLGAGRFLKVGLPMPEMLGAQGFRATAYEARTDWSMSLGSLYLLIAGAGPWSLDAWFASRR
jgi:uncharacterized membrane protein YphA (DoxX/SURF4 family)